MFHIINVMGDLLLGKTFLDQGFADGVAMHLDLPQVLEVPVVVLIDNTFQHEGDLIRSGLGRDSLEERGGVPGEPKGDG